MAKASSQKRSPRPESPSGSEVATRRGGDLGWEGKTEDGVGLRPESQEIPDLQIPIPLLDQSRQTQETWDVTHI